MGIRGALKSVAPDVVLKESEYGCWNLDPTTGLLGLHHRVDYLADVMTRLESGPHRRIRRNGANDFERLDDFALAMQFRTVHSADRQKTRYRQWRCKVHRADASLS